MHQLTTPGRHRALTALMLVWPGTPMLFQGQEFASSRPFLYFADHEPALARKVAAGRAEFLSQFPSLADPEITAGLPDPDAVETFQRCVLDWRERDSHAAIVALHRDLLHLRRATAAFRAQVWRGVDGAVLGNEAFVLRYFDGRPGDAYDGRDPQRGDRLLLVNLGRDLHLDAAPEPLLAPPEGCSWSLEWSSESTCYDGSGTPAVVSEERGWYLPGHAAIVLRPVAGVPPTERGPRRARSRSDAASHSKSD
jgi:maltooligosyltrehalose trehalohydrolase